MADGRTTPQRARRVVVVGAGVGALSAAISLAARGLAVTVLDRAPRVGGKMREVEVAGRRIDSGPTVLTVRAVFDELFAAAGASLDAYVTLDPVEVLARHAWADGSRLDLYRDVDRTADAIGALAGAREAKGYRAFCAYTKGIHEHVEGPFMRAQRPTLGSVLRDQGLRGMIALARIDATRTLWSALGDFFRDPRLLQLFGRYATYCGSSPFLAPATLNVIAHVEREGVWVVRGGMSRLAEALARLAAEQGVEFALGTGVSEVITDGHRATGVRLDDGRALEADAVVFNGDVNALATGLFGAPAQRAWPVDAGAARSLSAVTFSAVAKAGAFPLVRHNVFFNSDYASEFKDIFERQRLPREGTVYVCAQDRDDSAALPDASRPERLLCLVNAPATGDLTSLTPTEIDTCERTHFALMQRCGLSIDRQAHNTVLTTAADFHRLFPATGGALYGQASHGWMGPFNRPASASRVPGLYLAGGSVHPGPGVPMAAMSGQLAAEALMAHRNSTKRFHPVATSGGMSTR